MVDASLITGDISAVLDNATRELSEYPRGETVIRLQQYACLWLGMEAEAISGLDTMI